MTSTLGHGVFFYFISQNPALSSCVKHLKELQSLAIMPLMLKKQPAIVETVRMLQKYCGPSTQSANEKERRFKIISSRCAAKKFTRGSN
jgi:hypothetical protein